MWSHKELSESFSIGIITVVWGFLLNSVIKIIEFRSFGLGSCSSVSCREEDVPNAMCRW